MTSRVEALQAWLALEHEAVWLYGMVGARVDDLGESARRSFDAHRAVRDRLAVLIDDASAQPVGPRLTYGDDRVDSAGDARVTAQSVEQRITAACLNLFGSSGEDGRRFAMAGARRSALASLDWGGAPQAFPGLD